VAADLRETLALVRCVECGEEAVELRFADVAEVVARMLARTAPAGELRPRPKSRPRDRRPSKAADEARISGEHNFS
jgi:hypothetical protein